MNRELEFIAQPPQESEVATPFVTKSKGCANADTADGSELPSQVADELLSGSKAELPVKVN